MKEILKGPGITYDVFKNEMRTTLRLLCITDAQSKRSHITKVEKEIANLKGKSDSLSNMEEKLLRACRKDLSKLQYKAGKRKLGRIKNFYTEINEGNSAMLRRAMEKTNVTNNISEIHCNDNVIKDPSQILEIFRSHFEEIYKQKNATRMSKTESSRNFLNKIKSHKILNFDYLNLSQRWNLKKQSKN